MNPDEFIQALSDHGIELNHEQIQQFDTYYHTLVEWNKKMNLTGITDDHGVYLKHFYDSITASFYLDLSRNLAICDVGAGAGFPSIPLKICFPHIQVTIIDSLNKRITFLNHLADELGLTGVNFYHDRAENFAKKGVHREEYDIVIARAVARLPVLSELCLPLCRIGGTFIAMKASQSADEQKEAKKAITLMGGNISDVHHFTLPEDAGERTLMVIDKQRKTPNNYPRKAGLPNKQPILTDSNTH